MKCTLVSITLMAFVFMISACQTAKTEKEIAAGLCECLQPMTELYRQLQEQNEADPSLENAALKAKLEAAGLESEACTENIKIEYGEVMEKQTEEIKTAMETLCPKVVGTLAEIDAAYE